MYKKFKETKIKLEHTWLMNVYQQKMCGNVYLCYYRYRLLQVKKLIFASADIICVCRRVCIVGTFQILQHQILSRFEIKVLV